MANYATLKATIQQVVKTNGNNEITGALLQQSLLAMINSLGAGYQYAGVATPSTNPGTPDQNVFYIATTPGAYSNFGSVSLSPGEVAILKYNGAWTKDATNIATTDILRQVINVNAYNNKSDSYATRYAARQAVPSTFRVPGIIISYLYGEIWYTEQYIGPEWNVYLAKNFVDIIKGDVYYYTNRYQKQIRELYLTGISDLTQYNVVFYQKHYNVWGIIVRRNSDSTTVASGTVTQATKPDDGVIVVNPVGDSGISGYAYFTFNDVDDTGQTELYDTCLSLANCPLIVNYLSTSQLQLSINQLNNRIEEIATDIANELNVVFDDVERVVEFPAANNRAKRVSTIYGWGLAICENKTISSVSAIICAKTTAITKVRVQLLKGARNGESLADKTIDVNIAANTEQKVTFTFDAPVSYSGVIYCIVRYNAVGDWYKWIDYTNYPYPNILPCGIYNSWDANPTDVNAGFYLAVEYTEITLGLSQIEVEWIVNIVKNEIDLTELEQEVAETKAATDLNVALSLPDKIVAVVGDKLQLFYKGMVGAVNPYDLDILVTCSKGKQYPRYWEFTPAAGDVGEHTFNIKVKSNNGQILAEKSTTISVVAAPAVPDTHKNVVCFGDSNTVDGAWPAEAFRRLTGTGGSPAGKGLANISFCGLMTKKNAGYCGFGGWTWGSYVSYGVTAIRFTISGVETDPEYGSVYSNNGKNFTVQEVNITAGSGTILCRVANSSDRPTESGTLTRVSGTGDATISFSEYSVDSANPLWDTENNKFSFVPYANLYCNGTIDVVYTLLTWNGLVAWMENFSAMLATMTTFATTLHAEFPNAKLRILGMQVPPVLGSMSYADSYGMIQTILAMNDFYQNFANDHSEFVEFVNVSAQFDTDNNCRMDVKRLRNTRSFLSYDPNNKYYMGDTVDKAVYNAEAGAWIHTPWVCIVAEVTGEWDATKWQVAPERVYEDYCVNAVHPGYNGYCQIADAVYRDFVAAFCQ